MPQPDSETLTWIFIALACAAFAGMALARLASKRRESRREREAAEAARAPRRRTERVAARRMEGLSAAPEIPKFTPPVRPTVAGPLRPSVLVVEPAAGGASLAVIERADALELEGAESGLLPVAALSVCASDSPLAQCLASRSAALARTADGADGAEEALPENLFAVAVSVSGPEGSDEAASEAMANVEEAPAVIRMLDAAGLPVGEGEIAPASTGAVRRELARMLAHEAPGVAEARAALLERVAALRSAPPTAGLAALLPEAGAWLAELSGSASSAQSVAAVAAAAERRLGEISGNLVEEAAPSSGGTEEEKEEKREEDEARRLAQARERLVACVVCERVLRAAALSAALASESWLDAVRGASAIERRRRAFEALVVPEGLEELHAALSAELAGDVRDAVRRIDRVALSRRSCAPERILVRFVD